MIYPDLLPVVLGKSQSLMVVVFSGRNHLRKLRVKLSSPSAIFRYREAVLQKGNFNYFSFTFCNMNLDEEDEDEEDDDDDDDEAGFNADEDGICLEDVEEDTEIAFLVPHSDASALNAMVRNEL